MNSLLKNTRALGLSAALLTLAGPSSAFANALIIGAPGNPAWNIDVQSKIAATGLISGGVDVFNAATGTPTLGFLQGYSSVLFYSDTSFSNSTDLGDVLADYVDAGGGVVQATFSFWNSGIDISGRWRSGNYDVFVPGEQTSGSVLTLGTIYQPASPILAGVTSFNGGSSSYNNTVGGLNVGATLIADWSDGTHLIAENLSTFAGRIVGLNFYPPSSNARDDFWDANTDGALLMANALNHVASGNSSVPDGGSTLLALSGAVLLIVSFRRRNAA